MDELQRKIEYHFKSPRILCEALHPAGTAPLQGNKRLALVGDSALALSILDESYQRKETVGKGNKTLQEYACNSNLSAKGQSCDLDQYLEKHPAQKGGITEYMRASAVEAILGAVWIDSDMNIHAVDRVRKKLGLDN